MLDHVLFAIATYLVAALPFGVAISTLWGSRVDIRRAGSGNIGATNVARVHGWRVAAPVLVLDVAKGLIPVALARWIWPELDPWWPGLLAVVAFVGHCYPIYLDFRGGKGVATTAGAMLALSPWTALGAVALWVGLLRLTGRSSVAALGATAGLVGLVAWLDAAVLPIVGVLAAGIALTHLSNVRRLARGEEPTIVSPAQWGRRTEPRESSLDEGPAGGPARPSWPASREAASDLSGEGAAAEE